MEIMGLRSQWVLDTYQPETNRFAGDLPAKKRKSRIGVKVF